MTRWVKCLPRECEGLSSDSRHLHKAEQLCASIIPLFYCEIGQM